MEYAIEEKENIISCVSEIIKKEENQLLINVKFGNPFVLGEVNYIPIMSDKKIVALLSVSEYNGKKGWYLSKDFSEGLNRLSEKTTKSSPAQLYVEDGDVYAKTEKRIEKLTDNAFDTSLNVSQDQNNKEIIDIETPNLALNKMNYRKVRKAAKGAAKTLKLDRKEIQGKNSWCVAYAGASILRYRGHKEVYARNIMRFFYDLPEPKLRDKSLSYSQLIKYANKTGVYPELVYQALDINSVKRQINNDMPVFIGTWNQKGKGGHALVLCGYDTNKKIYHVWNPHNNYISNMSFSNLIVTVNGGPYLWKDSIRSWQ